MRTMESLEVLTVELKDVKGGEMLRRLRTLAGSGGDEASRQLHTFLLRQVGLKILLEGGPNCRWTERRDEIGYSSGYGLREVRASPVSLS